MKKYYYNFVSIIVVSLLLSLGSHCSGFTRVNTYEDGIFTDVSSTSWYAKEVAFAYELGFMNGFGEGAFAPDGNVTVAEAVTMASRVHAIYNGKEISKTEGKWYDMYVKYALVNGIISEGQFDNFDRNIMRYEMAVMFADSMPAAYFAAINDVKEIPDVDENEQYHDKLMMLYNAGVVMGSTEYGDFLATNPIKRSETAAIINRVALVENRLKKTLSEYDRRPAIYLIDNHSMTRTVRGRTMIASGWRYENTIDSTLDNEDKSSNTLTDVSTNGYAAMHRDITTVEKGIAELEAMYITYGGAYSVVLDDINGENMFTLHCDSDGNYFAIGDTSHRIDCSFEGKNVLLYMSLNLEKRAASVVINGNDIGTFDMSHKASDISGLSFMTDAEGKGSLTVNEVYMYADYVVNDEFRVTPKGSSPYGWETSGNVTVEKQVSDYNTNSARISGVSSATRNFADVSGKFVYETFVRVPRNQELELCLKNGEGAAVSVSIGGGEITCGDALVRSYNPGIWQLIRIEGDTNAGTALIKVNGKECLSTGLSEKSVDTISIKSSGKGYAYFDDVELYYTYDYPDYCPEPVPVTDDEWYVGMSVCSLWREGTHYGWDCITPYDEATPVLGYYDEGNPEVADWEIKMLVEHGYDFQHFCWYVGQASDGIKEPRLGDALHNGYFNAKYSHMQDFMLMWENNGYDFKTVEDFKNKVWAYWCDWYFSDERYFTIDNKPVLTIYNYQKFVDSLEGKESAAAVVAFMKEDIRRLGYDGMIVLVCNSSTSKSSNIAFRELGADATICYNFGESSYSPDYQKSCMNSAYNAGEISLMPSVSVGFNDIGWTETRTPNATPSAYKEVLEWCRDDYMPRIAQRESEAWKSRFIIGNTWNEYGEGHYIMPSNVCGFGYIDANRQIFSAAYGTDDSAHFDITPTINQKKRMGTLYPNRTQLIRRTYWIEDEKVNPDELDVVKGWYFDRPEECFYWRKLMNTTEPVYSANEKALCGTALSNDAGITAMLTDDDKLLGDEIDYLKIKIKYDKPTVTGVTLYFRTEEDNSYSQDRAVRVTTKGLDDYEHIYLGLYENRYWRGNITNLRLDPLECEGTYLIKSIEFLGGREKENGFVLDVDGVKVSVNEKFVKKAGGEIFVAGNPTDGFYSINNFYTEWNRYKGELFLRTGTGHDFVFSVGSGTALVDGKEKKMASTFDTVDGLPYIPIKFVYDNAEIEYSLTKDGIEAEIRGRDVIKAVTSRVKNEYEFNVDTDLEGWSIGCATGNVSDGMLVMEATTNSAGAYDPQVSNTKVEIDTDYYSSCVVRVRPVFDNPDSVNTPYTLYFATNEETTLNEAKTSKIYPSQTQCDGEGFYVLDFDLSANELWRGTALTIRFDPTNSKGVYEIDYIKMVADPDAEEKLAAEKKRKQEREKLLSAVDDGGPFYIENADAEDLSVLPLSHPGYVALKISEDDLVSGNHAFEYVPDGKNKNWAYTMIPTRFKPGITYKVEFDIRVTRDHTGEEIEKANLAWNLRYSDTVDGTFKEMADHHASLGSFGTADGWQRVSFEHTVSENSVIRANDYFAIFASPLQPKDGSYRVVGYMIDNIKVSAVE